VYLFARGSVLSLFSLKDRVALVTGAGRGIGRGIAEGFGQQGATVVCAARSADQIDEVVSSIQNQEGKALALQIDVSDLDSITATVDTIISQFGQIDILVNNAGMNVRQPFMEVTEDNYDQIMDVNLKGLYFLSQAVAKHMVPRQKGKIINIGSLTTGITLDQISVYTATKGAVGQLTKSQALELGPYNIQANAISPGFVVTPLTEKIWSDKTMRDWGEAKVPIGRLAQPEDMIGTAVFLASSASDYVTGQIIYVDGGFMTGDVWPLPSAASN